MMSLLELFIFVGAVSVPVSMMLANDYRVARHHETAILKLPACFNRYSSLIVLTCVYGGMFYVLLLLYTTGYLDDGRQTNLPNWHDFLVPTACLSTISILLFGYIMQADNAFYLNSLMQEEHKACGKMDLIYRTFRSISIGQIAPGILYPMSVSLWALHGAWLYNIYNIVIRASNHDLIPRVFFYGTVRTLMALFVSMLIYCVFQAFFKPYELTEDKHQPGLKIANRKNAYILIALAFFSGLFPVQAAMSTWQQIKSSELLGELFSPSPTLSITHLQGMNAWMADRLFEEGIVDIHQLAMIGDRCYALHQRIKNLISQQQLEDWIDQAKLMLFINDAHLLASLRSAGIRGKMQMNSLIASEHHDQLAQLIQNMNNKKDEQTKRFIMQYALTRSASPSPQASSTACTQ